MVTPGLNPATLPPSGLDGLDPNWSRLVTVDAIDQGRTFHLLDSHATANSVEPKLTLLCVHGNPSWSYLWRHLIAAAPSGVRVVAVDHLDMGFSERTGEFRRLGTRVEDLAALTAEMGIDGPVVTVAHDWGGPISLGWAARHRSQLQGVVLLNTAVHQPQDASAPRVIRAVRSRGVLGKATVDTTAFIQGAFQMSNPRPTAAVKEGFLAPYSTPERRKAIGEFVQDIPLEPSHPTALVLDNIAASLDDLADVPALLIWGSADKVFSDLYLHDLEARLPHAQVHRHPKAGHFVSEDTDSATTIVDWVGALGSEGVDRTANTASQPLGAALADDTIARLPAVIQMGQSAAKIDFGSLLTRVEETAQGLVAHGVKPQDRVALMIPPSVDLVVSLYACWRLGAVGVLIDSGLGPKGMSAAIKSANPQHLIGIPKALAAAKALRWPGARISSEPLAKMQSRLLAATTDLVALRNGNHDQGELPQPNSDSLAAVVFTSGSTGPSKGVLYTHRQLDAQKQALMDLFKITNEDRLVAAFAPFALYGPAMGITSAVPDMDVTAPASLTARALAAAAVAADATMIFASPSALANVVRTAGELSAAQIAAFSQVRMVMSAGAPVKPSVVADVVKLFPNAQIHTPYGMTEVLPVASIERAEILEAAANPASETAGVCVGKPLAGVSVQIRQLDALGQPTGPLTTEPGAVGEVVVQASHAFSGYDRLWHTTHKAAQPAGWHSTGDVGQLDAKGRLWIDGRTSHVISTTVGPVTPVKSEQQLEDLPGVQMAAVVGTGPAGTQHLVAVLQTAVKSPALASLDLIDSAREVTGQDLAAVFEVPALPVDKRHNAKIDRTAVAAWAEAGLAGGKLGSL